MCDVLYTNDIEPIAAMIAKAMQERRKKLELNQDMLVDMRPEFAAALTGARPLAVSRSSITLSNSFQRKSGLPAQGLLQEEALKTRDGGGQV